MFQNGDPGCYVKDELWENYCTGWKTIQEAVDSIYVRNCYDLLLGECGEDGGLVTAYVCVCFEGGDNKVYRKVGCGSKRVESRMIPKFLV
jgi:hypothetical protein